MYRIELAPGEETALRTVEELAIGIRNGVITSRARIWHRTARIWLPIEMHPHYRAALEQIEAAEAAEEGAVTSAPAPGAEAVARKAVHPSEVGDTTSGKSAVTRAGLEQSGVIRVAGPLAGGLVLLAAAWTAATFWPTGQTASARSSLAKSAPMAERDSGAGRVQVPAEDPISDESAAEKAGPTLTEEPRSGAADRPASTVYLPAPTVSGMGVVVGPREIPPLRSDTVRPAPPIIPPPPVMHAWDGH